MKMKINLLSLAVATILAGCGATGPGKPGVVQQERAQAVPSQEEAPHSGDARPSSGGMEGGDSAAVLSASEAPSVAPVVSTAPTGGEEQERSAAVAAGSSVATTPRFGSSVSSSTREYEIPDDPHLFVVVSEQKDRSHPFYGQGIETGFTVNGEQGKELVLTRGDTYTFKVDTGVQHDFYFTTSPQGWGAGTYTDGVEGQFIFKGEVVFTPNEATPDLLYYQCRNHKFMGGKIYVLDKGEDLAALKASLAALEAKQAAGGSAQRPVSKEVSPKAVRQKLGYAQMVLMSKSAKRVEGSGNPEAIAILEQARQKIASAKATLEGGDAARAMEEVDEGLRLITAASRVVTTESEMAGVNHKAKYDELTGSLKTYEGSYARNLDRLKKAGQKPKSKLDKAEYDRLVAEGERLAGKGDYVAAAKSLEKAQHLITTVLTDMLHAQTITYDKNFETPQEEYEYELARLESYEELVPLAIEQKRPSQRALGLIDSFVEKAARIKREGLEIAAKGDYKMAIMAMQAATSNIQRALRIAGVN